MMKASATVLANAVLLIVYFAAAEFGLSFFALIHPSASAVWLPTGVAMAALLLGGFRLLPAVLAGAFLANVTTAGSIASSLAVAVGNGLEAMLAVTLVERFAGGSRAFTSSAGILKFMVLAALLSTTVSATIGVLSLTLAGVGTDADTTEVWLTWWLGDAAGAVVVTPFVVLWWTNRSWVATRPLAEAALVIVAIGGVGGATFFDPRLSQYPIAFLCLAPLVWGALRFGPREIATAIVVLAVIATTATATDRGPFAILTTNKSLIVLHEERLQHDQRLVRDPDDEQVADRAAGVPRADRDDGVTDGGTDRRAARRAEARACGTRGCGRRGARQG